MNCYDAMIASGSTDGFLIVRNLIETTDGFSSQTILRDRSIKSPVTVCRFS